MSTEILRGIQGADGPLGEVVWVNHFQLNREIGVDFMKKKAPSCLVCTLNMCNKILYYSFVVRTIFYAVVGWGEGIPAKDANGLNELKTGSVIGLKQVTLEAVGEDRKLAKLVILGNILPPLTQHVSQV